MDRTLLQQIPGTPADKSESKQSIFTHAELFDLIFFVLTSRLLAKQPTTPRHLFDLLNFRDRGYTRANSIGDVVGHSIDGLRLHRGRKRSIMPCRENLRLLLDRATDEQIEQLLGELEIDFAELVRQIESLPLAKPEVE